jgi:hypothetical protein
MRNTNRLAVISTARNNIDGVRNSQARRVGDERFGEDVVIGHLNTEARGHDRFNGHTHG